MAGCCSSRDANVTAAKQTSASKSSTLSRCGKKKSAGERSHPEARERYQLISYTSLIGTMSLHELVSEACPS